MKIEYDTFLIGDEYHHPCTYEARDAAVEALQILMRELHDEMANIAWDGAEPDQDVAHHATRLAVLGQIIKDLI